MTANDFCKQFEGLRLEAYRCPAGIWTIGYGHTDGVTDGMVINADKAESLLNDDLDKCRQQVRRLLKIALTENQFEALIDFCFNLGAGNLKKSTLLKMVNLDPDDPAIRGEFLKWVKVNNRVMPGLVKRRSAEADLYFT